MTSFSLGTIWEETIAFMRREAGLTLPVALATFGLAQVALGLGMGDQAGTSPSAQIFGPRTILVLPALLLMMLGNLAISRIVLMPGRRIGELLAEALRALPRALAAMLLVAMIMLGILVLVAAAASVGAITFQVDPKSLTQQIVTLMLVPMVTISIRLMLLVPVVAVEKLGPAASIRRAWALSRDHYLRFFGMTAVMIVLLMLLALIQVFVVGTLFRFLGLAIGDAQLVAVLQEVVNAALESVFSLGIATFIALVYRQLTAAG